jgi:hypothetical protein
MMLTVIATAGYDYSKYLRLQILRLKLLLKSFLSAEFPGIPGIEICFRMISKIIYLFIKNKAYSVVMNVIQKYI